MENWRLRSPGENVRIKGRIQAVVIDVVARWFVVEWKESTRAWRAAIRARGWVFGMKREASNGISRTKQELDLTDQIHRSPHKGEHNAKQVNRTRNKKNKGTMRW